MASSSQSTYDQDEYFHLSFHESSELYLFLVKYFSKLNHKFDNLVRVKFQIIKLLLSAHLGIKSTLFGTKKTAPYELKNQEDVEEQLTEINREIRDLTNQSIVFYDIYVNLAKYFKYPYTEFNEYRELVKKMENTKLQYLKKDFDEFGIEKSIEEYAKLLDRYSSTGPYFRKSHFM